MRKLLLSFLAVLSVGAMSGCGDAPTAPASAGPRPEARQEVLGLVALTPVLQRREPLASDITVTARIGYEGGVIAIPAAGLRVVVPRGAVSAPVDFTATALAGNAVAYEFAPHGMTFANKLVVTQELRGTEWIGLPVLNMKAGYFKDVSQLDTERALVRLDEVLPLSVDLLRLQVRFNVGHFSGYIISTGRAQAPIDD